MVPEDATIGSFVSKQHLKMTFFNEEFSLLLTECDKFDSAEILLKKLEPVTKPAPLFDRRVPYFVTQAAEVEEGEVEDLSAVQVVYKPLDRKAKLREVLEGCTIFEYPTLYVVV